MNSLAPNTVYEARRREDMRKRMLQNGSKPLADLGNTSAAL